MQACPKNKKSRRRRSQASLLLGMKSSADSGFYHEKKKDSLRQGAVQKISFLDREKGVCHKGCPGLQVSRVGYAHSGEPERYAPLTLVTGWPGGGLANISARLSSLCRLSSLTHVLLIKR